MSTYERLKERDYFKRIERYCDGEGEGKAPKPLKRKETCQKTKKSVRRVLNVDSSEDEGGNGEGVQPSTLSVSPFAFTTKRSRSSLTSMVEWLEKVLPPADEKKLLAEEQTGAELVLQATFVANNTIYSKKDGELEECKKELEKERKLKARAEMKTETMQRMLRDRVKHFKLERDYIFKEGFKSVCYKLLNSNEFSRRMADTLEANDHCIRSKNSKASHDALKVTLGMVHHMECGFLDDINPGMSLDSLKAWSPPDGDRPGMKKWLFL